MTDRIFVSNLSLHGHHGVMDAEKSLGQKFMVDMECSVIRPGNAADRISDTVHYGELCDLAAEVSASSVFNLIETFADTVAQAILDRFALVQEVTVTVRKPSAPISHVVDHVGVSVTRGRNG
ncbi:dihydroneopterin aldolase [Hyphomonas johnsonii]|uniref:7,8-dihydroneopterin aldolase n=1 Tax=Hyphomonas johnsonii MHS-2 TaxID=1280950 RepID=A0A059FTE3_9PROT|nr:dihydroneopterin aldolase [Hyphomonas johnsonii]KCZ93945.1 dihydroneopterin aldolase [Hyphomonas johnsonii MHS-2]